MRVVAALAAIVAALFSVDAQAQNYPDRPVTVIVPYAPGGNTDVIARIMLEGMTPHLGQRFVIENVAGAGGTTGSGRAAKATPDGYTLLVGQMGTHAASVGLYGDKLGYDPVNDFEHVSQFTDTPIGIFVKKDFPAKTLAELVARLKADSTRLTNGHGGVGSTSQVSCMLFSSIVGARATPVGYRGSGPALNDLITGQFDFLCDQIPHTIGHVECRLDSPARDRAEPSARRWRRMFRPRSRRACRRLQASGWNAMFAPKGTPKAIVDKLADAAAKAAEDPVTRKRLEDIGAVVPPPERRGSQALRNFVAAEVAKWTPVIKAAGASGN